MPITQRCTTISISISSEISLRWASLITAPFVLVGEIRRFPPRRVPEFIAYAKANPGKINVGSLGPGSPSQELIGVLFKSMAEIDLTTVNYRGGSSARRSPI